MVEELACGEAEARVREIRRDVAERREHEAPLVEAWVGDLKAG